MKLFISTDLLNFDYKYEKLTNPESQISSIARNTPSILSNKPLFSMFLCNRSDTLSKTQFNTLDRINCREWRIMKGMDICLTYNEIVDKLKILVVIFTNFITAIENRVIKKKIMMKIGN